jgi:hypothetical protein
MMTGNTTAQARETAARASGNAEYVRLLLELRQPRFADALESAVAEHLRDHGRVCASRERSTG